MTDHQKLIFKIFKIFQNVQKCVKNHVGNFTHFENLKEWRYEIVRNKTIKETIIVGDGSWWQNFVGDWYSYFVLILKHQRSYVTNMSSIFFSEFPVSHQNVINITMSTISTYKHRKNTRDLFGETKLKSKSQKNRPTFFYFFFVNHQNEIFWDWQSCMKLILHSVILFLEFETVEINSS